jgi:hypothetical protein
MSTKLDEMLPSAKAFAEKVALAEAEQAARLLKQQQDAEAEKRSLLDNFKRPSGVSDEEGIRRAVAIIQRAVSNGLTEVQVYRFPNDMCTDRGRAINQGEAGWETTLTGVPKEIYQLWNKYFRDKGYKLKVEIVDFPNGVPGDVGMTLKWG